MTSVGPDGTDAVETVARTRGGFIPTGTGERRRQTHVTSGNERGRQRRAAILEAAKRVFERMGYLDARVEDIVDEAGVSRGSFYTYFESKRDPFRELSSEIGALVKVASGTPPETRSSSSAYERLEGTVRRYLDLYRHEARMLGLIEQMSTIDEVIHSQRLEGRRHHVRRVAGEIRRLQQRGIADAGLNPTATAAALVSMLSNLAFWYYAGGDNDAFDEASAVQAVTRIWAAAIGIAPQ